MASSPSKTIHTDSSVLGQTLTIAPQPACDGCLTVVAFETEVTKTDKPTQSDVTELVSCVNMIQILHLLQP